MSAICERLNPPQTEAVLTTKGPMLILAGAGSGKTRVLTHRIAYLIEEAGVKPWNILAITFTNKAAEEMRSRVCAMCPQGESVNVSTFHAACVRMLRSGADRLGYGRDFTIYDTDDTRTLMKQIIKGRELDPKSYRERDTLKQISSLKNDMVSAEDFSRISGGNFRESRIAELYTEYQRRLMAANAMDFDDLLVNTVTMFQENPDLLEQYRARFRYIMVDEYQDTNTVQFRLVELLAREHKNLCVVGDDDQSIYKFRGADIRNILDFEKHFPEAKVIRLEQNYRSAGNILAAANAVIAHNTERKEKTLWTDRAEGEKVIFRQYGEGREEAEDIARDIEKEKNIFPYGDCAVLYRTNAQSRALEEAFVSRGLPYRLIGGTNFYSRKEVKDVIAYLKTVANGLDDVAAERIINVPRRGIGDTTVARIRETAEYYGISFYDAISRAAEDPALKRAAGKLRAFTGLITSLREKARTMRVWQMIEEILVGTGYQEEILMTEESTVAQTRLENVRELENKAADFRDEPGEADSLNRFLEDVALVSEVDALGEDENRVVLMTLHSAKGLEFPKVYISGMEQGLFPHSPDFMPAEELEEERRLCYVGITRARDKLILTAAKMRMLNGEFQYHNISQFVEEIPKELVRFEGNGRMETRAQTVKRLQQAGDFGKGNTPAFGKAFPGNGFGRGIPEPAGRKNGKTADKSGFGWTDFGDSFGFMQTAPKKKQEELLDPAEIASGDRVKHRKFGTGTVLSVRLVKGDRELQIRFDDGSVRTLLASFARLVKAE